MTKVQNIIFIILLGYFSILQAQVYQTALGVRFNKPDGLGATLQFTPFKREKLSLETIVLSDFKESTNVLFLAEEHRNFIGKRFNYYYGLGPQFTFNKTGSNAFGLGFIIGFEATMFGLNFSWDYMPIYNLTGGVKSLGHTTGISARRVLTKHKRKFLFW